MAKARAMKRSSRNAPTRSRFGPVSTINTAPVAIGNSIRGSKPQVSYSADGCRVVGRDFCFELKSTAATITGWSLIGGMPVTPSVLATSSLRSYAQMFSKFKVNRMAFHYITSSPTTQAGDIMFYYERDRNGPAVDQTSNSFLPYVLSDPNTIIGPQWNNHTMMVKPIADWNSTNYGMTTDLNEETDGSVFVYSKTNSANSPGYILVDFDITFKEMCVNPRAGLLPVTRGIWNYLTLGLTATAVTTGTAATLTVQGSNPDSSASTAPNGAAVGDIYKIIFQVTNSTIANAAWTNATTANVLAYRPNSTSIAVTVDDGFTCYGTMLSTTSVVLYPSLDAAKAGNNWLCWGVAATVTVNICTLVSLVGSINGNAQSSY
jgi:hypothetical protein